MAAKMLALFAFLALCASAASATYIPGYFPSTMALGAVNPCMQYCAMQQAFTMGRFTSAASMMMQRPFTSLFQQYLTPMMIPSMMTMQQQCHCSAISQIMQQQQLPFSFNPMAMAIPPFSFQQPFVGAAF
uniref:Methionine-rich protein n=1 Tax=Echinochloa crus-galli subsp. hispidula TaxID=1502359 RepID=A0A0G2QUV3_ECHCG|nr:methionine-rich protein [Echinochloa crus-galli subsp. hispidula]